MLPFRRYRIIENGTSYRDPFERTSDADAIVSEYLGVSGSREGIHGSHSKAPLRSISPFGLVPIIQALTPVNIVYHNRRGVSRGKIIIFDILSLIYVERMDILNYFFTIVVAINTEIREKSAEIASFLYRICECLLKFSYFYDGFGEGERKLLVWMECDN